MRSYGQDPAELDPSSAARRLRARQAIPRARPTVRPVSPCAPTPHKPSQPAVRLTEPRQAVDLAQAWRPRRPGRSAARPPDPARRGRLLAHGAGRERSRSRGGRTSPSRVPPHLDQRRAPPVSRRAWRPKLKATIVRPKTTRVWTDCKSWPSVWLPESPSRRATGAGLLLGRVSWRPGPRRVAAGLLGRGQPASSRVLRG